VYALELNVVLPDSLLQSENAIGKGDEIERTPET